VDNYYPAYIISYPYPVLYPILTLSYPAHQTGPKSKTKKIVNTSNKYYNTYEISTF
jgi:hypothetical protein